MEVFARLLDGMHANPKVKIWGSPTTVDRVPTLAFTVDAHTSDEVAAHLAKDHIAVWAGHSYAVEVVGQLGLDTSGGVVRAGVVRYITNDDVDRLVSSIDRLVG
jgi:selenocysteine lyase/cysteine desulfurase